MKKRKKVKKALILSIIFVILLAITSIHFIMKNIYNQDRINENKLKQLGYSSSDITIIVNNENYLNYALNNQYESNLISLINNKNFKFEYLNSYLNYLKDNEKVPIDDAIYLINNDINYAYSEELMNIVKTKYFLKNRLERYINYQDKNNKLDEAEIIKRVNSNIDYNFYTNIETSDVSFGYLLICNKHYKLSSTYTGNLVTMDNAYSRKNGAQLDSKAYEAFKALSDAAKNEGLYILNQSAYRSYSNQESIYNNYLNNKGRTWTDKWSARPGHSEHQTGLALDVGTYTTIELDDFEFTKEFTWMQNNAYKYGFILRYPDGKEYITGYGYEPWHYRYVGVDAATTIQNENITYEEYYAYYVLKK